MPVKSRIYEMKIIIVEDDPRTRESMKVLLDGEQDITVLNVYATAEEALTDLKKGLQPDVMLVDIGLPEMPGIEFVKKAKELVPESEIMIFTVFEDRDTILSAIKAGASGYILKGASPREIIEALKEINNGGAPMSPKIARALIKEFQEENIAEQYLLTPREVEIIKAIEKGLSYKEISSTLNISVHTVHTHIKNIYEKLQAKNRTDALIKARKKGII